MSVSRQQPERRESCVRQFDSAGIERVQRVFQDGQPLSREITAAQPGDQVRVIRVIGRLNVGGPAIHVVNLSAGLDRRRFRQQLVVGTEKRAEGSMLDYALSRGVTPHVIPEIVTSFRLGARDAKAVAKLYALMRRERPDIVHTHTAKAGFIGRIAARLAGVPVVVHTFHGHVLHGYYGAFKSGLLRATERRLARLSDRLIAVSDQVKRDLVAYGIAEPARITVIPLGFELDPFLNASSQRGAFRGEIGCGADARLVGIVGRIFPIKNHELFLQAAARVAAREAKARFVIVGDGPLRPALERQARQLKIAGRVFFTGWRRDLARIYADLDALVVSSDNEGTPVSAIEAMAAGCPVAATRVGGLPDLITDGETGVLVPPRDAERLANAVTRILSDGEFAQSLGSKATSAIRRRFGVKRLIGDIDRLYCELLALKRPARSYDGAADAR